MNDIEEKYDVKTAVAWILGHARRTGIPALLDTLLHRTADECDETELLQIVEMGQVAEVRLYPFKHCSFFPRQENLIANLAKL